MNLIKNQWLSVETTAGEHTFSFRYQPWDVPLGLGISILGLVLCLGLWLLDDSSGKEGVRGNKS